MSKTFKSSSQANDNRTLSVEELYGEPRLMISGDVRMGFLLDPSDAPALALAVLEAAGAIPTVPAHALFEYGTKAHLENIFLDLARYVEASKKRNAEARERAELEAEALELFNTARATRDIEPLEWDEVADKDTWVAVARRAREIRNEKKVTTDD